jgi:hypothetical protein
MVLEHNEFHLETWTCNVLLHLLNSLPRRNGLEPTYMNTLPQIKNANIAWICAPYCISTNRKMQERRELEKASSKCMFTLIVLICASWASSNFGFWNPSEHSLGFQLVLEKINCRSIFFPPLFSSSLVFSPSYLLTSTYL